MKPLVKMGANKSIVEFLTQKINEETSEYGEASPFGVSICDEKGDIIAGANGFVLYGAVYTDQLWVDKLHRRKGLGQSLMESIHELGRSKGCNIATVQTMSFQHAQPFYERLGYIVDFKRAGLVNGSRCIFMKKTL